MKILIADDHKIVRHGTKTLIHEWWPDAIITEADNFDDVITSLEKDPADLLILDINMPGGNHLNIISQIKLRRPGIKILIFSAYEEHIYAERYLKEGAHGYLNKLAANSEIKSAIEIILANGKYESLFIKEQSSDVRKKKFDNPLDMLSDRELEVAQLLIQGLSVIEIAKKLNREVSTISTHKLRMLKKLNITNTIELLEKFKLYSNINP